jgi:hypothetical protein
MFLPCFASAILIILAFSVATKEDEVWMSNTRRWVGSTSAGESEPGSRGCPESITKGSTKSSDHVSA